jgi:hypothetical protein
MPRDFLASATPPLEDVLDIFQRGVDLPDILAVIVASQTRVHQIAHPPHVAVILSKQSA